MVGLEVYGVTHRQRRSLEDAVRYIFDAVSYILNVEGFKAKQTPLLEHWNKRATLPCVPRAGEKNENCICTNSLYIFLNDTWIPKNSLSILQTVSLFTYHSETVWRMESEFVQMQFSFFGL